MMKMMCYKKGELEKILEDILQKKRKRDVTCNLTINEECGEDVIEILGEKEPIALKSLISDLSLYIKEIVTDIDVMEVGDFGENFILLLDTNSGYASSL